MNPTRSLVFVALLALSSCLTPREFFMQGGHGNNPGVDKAAFDLECPKDSLLVQELNHLEFGVKGCGKSATYHFTSAQGWYRVD